MNVHQVFTGILKVKKLKALMKYYFPPIVIFFLFTPYLIAQEKIKGNLVSVEWLKKNLQKNDILILDASPAKIYTEQHIPGAVNVDIYAYGVQEMPAAVTEQLYQSWGVSNGKKIIIYDQGGSIQAARVFFSLYYDGFPAKDLLILDGGIAKWQEAGFPVTKELPEQKKGTFKITKSNEDVRARLPEFLIASGDPDNNALVEGLPGNWHFGEVQVFDRAGHIPNGILLPSADFYNPDKTFKSPEEIKKMLDYLNISPEQQIYTYCGGGVAACVPFFAIKFMLNYPNVKLYKESEMGWLKDERGLPYWTYDAPNLIREPNWLNSWGGKMMRMYGVSKVNIVDVRTEGEFKEGHIPFAVNIPADFFERYISDPAKLTEILGTSGVNASEEAIVISGAGLTKEAALAFVLLEKLGQKKVSVFMDSMDKWVKHGYTIIKDTAGEVKKAANDLAAPSATYTGNLRKEIIISDLNATNGLYPKVFIASGKGMPAKTQNGKVVHVPYTDLLNSDGTPKAAKDIWNILTEAGIPRYAELICFSDEPGEAAVNYFILKLMGYPDIKVLVI